MTTVTEKYNKLISRKLRDLNGRLKPDHLFFPPQWLVLGVNNACNLHCKMCDVGTQTESNFRENLVGTHPINMPLPLIKEVIDQAATYYPKVKLGYAFTEPLVYPHLLESLDYAKQHDLFTTITTNALTLPQKAEGLVKAGLNELYVSLDGPPEIHNTIRGHQRSFEKAKEGIEMLLNRADSPSISIFCTISDWNIGCLYALAEEFRDLPIKQICFMHTNFTPNDVVKYHNHHYGQAYPVSVSSLEEISIEKINLNDLYEEIMALQNEDWTFDVAFAPELNSRQALEVFYREPGKFIGKSCNDIFSNVMIKSDGSVIPSHGRCYNISVGNIYEQTLPEIWHSDQLTGFRKDVMKAGGLLPACSRCCSAF